MTSFGCHIAFMFPSMRTILCVYIKALVCVLLISFCHIKWVSYKTIHEEYFPTKNDNYLAVHEKPERIAIFATKVCTYKRMFSVNQEIGVHNTK